MVFHFLFNLIPLLPLLHLITPHPVEKNISEEEMFLLPHSLNAGTEVEAEGEKGEGEGAEKTSESQNRYTGGGSTVKILLNTLP